MTPIDNNRDTNRTKRRIRVRFGVGRLEKTAFTMNVSETGMFIHTNHVHAPGKTIQVEIGNQGQRPNIGLVGPAARADPA